MREGENGAYGTPLIFWEEQKVWRYPILLGKYEVGNYDYWTNMVFVCLSEFTYQREHLFFYFMGHPKAHLSLYVTQLTTFSIQPTDPFLWCVFYMMVGAKMQKWRVPRFSCPFFKFITQSLSVPSRDFFPSGYLYQENRHPKRQTWRHNIWEDCSRLQTNQVGPEQVKTDGRRRQNQLSLRRQRPHMRNASNQIAFQLCAINPRCRIRCVWHF